MLLMIMPKEMHVYLLNGGNDIFNELTRALNASAQLNAEKSVVRTSKTRSSLPLRPPTQHPLTMICGNTPVMRFVQASQVYLRFSV
jgi:hypothetical protein